MRRRVKISASSNNSSSSTQHPPAAAPAISATGNGDSPIAVSDNAGAAVAGESVELEEGPDSSGTVVVIVVWTCEARRVTSDGDGDGDNVEVGVVLFGGVVAGVGDVGVFFGDGDASVVDAGTCDVG